MFGSSSHGSAITQPIIPEDPPDDPEPKLECMTGIRHDCQARLPLCGDDWRCSGPRLQKVVSASCFAYVVQIFPAIIFGEELRGWTDGYLGITETVVAMGLLGIVYTLLAGNGMVLVGVTGPSALFVKTTYELALSIGAPFLPFLAWTCYWSGLMHLVLAAGGATSFVHWITNCAPRPAPLEPTL